MRPSATASRCCGSAARSARFAPERFRSAGRAGRSSREIVRTDVRQTEGRSGSGRVPPSAQSASKPLRCFRSRISRSHLRTTHRAYRRSPSTFVQARSLASPASTATARNSSPRRWPGSAMATGGSVRLDGNRDRDAERRRTPPARSSLPDRRPAGRRHGRQPSRSRPTSSSSRSAPRRSGATASNSAPRSTSAPPQLVREYDVRTPSLKTPVGAAFGRQYPEGAAGARTGRRRQGRDLQQADLRARSRTISLASRQRIRDTAARGIAILLISTDLDELLEHVRPHRRHRQRSAGRHRRRTTTTPAPRSVG